MEGRPVQWSLAKLQAVEAVAHCSPRVCMHMLICAHTHTRAASVLSLKATSSSMPWAPCQPRSSLSEPATLSFLRPALALSFLQFAFFFCCCFWNLISPDTLP